METKHSPAPWQAVGGATPRYRGIIDAHGRFIVRHFADHQDQDGGALEKMVRDYDEQYSNSKLMAKAPELLASLEKMTRWAEILNHPLRRVGLSDDIQEAQELIQKAK